MLKSQREFLDKFLGLVTRVGQLVQQAETVYAEENDTHNHLKQVMGHPLPNPDDREGGFLHGRSRDKAEVNWLAALARKQQLSREMPAVTVDMRDTALEAGRMVASGGDEDFATEAKILVVLASDLLFKSKHWQHILLHIEKPRIAVDEVLKHRFERSVHELSVTSLGVCSYCDR